MATMDDPFKHLILECKEEFIGWLSHQKVQSVRELPTELLRKPDPLRTDLIFEVTLFDGRMNIVHIEVQGRTSNPPMPIRELLYIALTIERYPDIPIMSVVIYFGQGAGKDDDGHHRVFHPNGSVTIEWNYDVIRLADMTAEEIIALDNTDLLPLVVQTYIANPKEVIPPVIEQIQQVVDPKRRHLLLKSIVQFTTSQEVYQMIEESIAVSDIYEDLYVVQKARKEGYTLGLEEGQLQMLRANILDTLRFRLNASDTDLGKIETMLSSIQELDALQRLFQTAWQIESITNFWSRLFSQN